MYMLALCLKYLPIIFIVQIISHQNIYTVWCSKKQKTKQQQQKLLYTRKVSRKLPGIKFFYLYSSTFTTFEIQVLNTVLSRDYLTSQINTFHWL